MAERDSDSWMTPARVYEACEKAWGRPALDPCWHPDSPVDPEAMITPPGDGLAVDWTTYAAKGWVWLNPPYSNPRPWLEKATATPTVALVRADTSTRWWRDLVWGYACAVGFFHKRLRFGGPASGAAKFPSALVVFDCHKPYFFTTGYGELDTYPPDLDVHWIYP